MKKLSKLLIVLTLVMLLGTSALLVACNKDEGNSEPATTPSYKVTFIKNYPGSDVDAAFANVTVRQGRVATALVLDDTDRPAGYDFDGWYTQKTDGELFDFQTKITKNTVLYARWKANGKSTDVSLGGNVFVEEKVTVKTKNGNEEISTGVWRYVVQGTDDNAVPHQNSVFDLGTEIISKLSAANPDATYTVWRDEECAYYVNDDKNNLVVNLKNGNNIYYVKAVAEESIVSKVYKINVYLEPKFDLTVVRIQGKYSTKVVISDIVKGQKAKAPQIGTNTGYTFVGWYYDSDEQRNQKGQIVDTNGDVLVKVDGKYYFADENGERRFAYVDENGKNVVFYKGKYYLTDKSGARTTTEVTDIYNRIDENGLPVYEEGTPVKVGSKTEYVWDFDTNVVDREDITVYGKWAANQYSITLRIAQKDKDAGAKFFGSTASELIIENVKFNSTSDVLESLIGEKTGNKTPEKPHAKFGGWYYTDAITGEEIQVIDGTGKGVHAYDFEQDITLVAKFISETYKVVAKANDDTMSQEVTGSNDAAPYDQKVTLTATPKAGYKLVGWLLNGEKYDAFGANTNVEYTINEADVVNGQITFTAVYDAKEIKVTFVSDVDSYNADIFVKFNSSVALGANAIPDVSKLSEDGTKRFIGWYRVVTIDGVEQKEYVVKYNYSTNKNEVLMEKWNYTDDVTFTAEWLPYEFGVTVYMAKPPVLPLMGTISTDFGWDSWTAMTSEYNGYELIGYKKAFANGTTVVVNASIETDALYAFSGWKILAEDGTLQDVADYDGGTRLSVTVDEKDVVYVAFWNYKQVKVSFDKGDAPDTVVAPETTYVDYDTLLELPLPTGAPDEKSFAGWWYGDVQYTGADGKSFDSRTFNDVNLIQNGITLVAKWDNVNYFKINNGVIIGIDTDKARQGDTYKSEFTINFDDEVVAIASGAFKNNKFIKKITIKGNITSIGEEAFADSSIEQVVFEGNFKGLVIGKGAFRDCTGIKEIILPDNVTNIDEGVFEGCYSLTKLAYSAEVELGRLFTTRNPANDNYWYAAEQDGVRYYLPKMLREIVVTNTSYTIADHAFENAKYLSTVTLATKNGDKPYTRIIGNSAFMNTCLKVGDEINNIVVDLSLVETIGNSAFRNSSIKTVDFSSLKELGIDAFKESYVTSVDFSVSSLDNVTARAFESCSSLVSVNLKGIKTISASAFANSNLSVVTNADMLEKIEKYAFYKSGINSVSVFKDVVDIGEYAFHDTQYFQNASGIVVIGKVLYYDKGAASITADTTVVRIAPYAFKETTLATVDLSGFTALKSVESYAFAMNANITEVLLPVGLTDIKDSAFRGSSLQKIDLSTCDNVKFIWQYAFADCANLSQLIFASYENSESFKTKLEIGQYAFSGCTSLTSVTLPENLATLDAYAFKGCTNLITVKLIDNTKFLPPETSEGDGTSDAETEVPAFDEVGLITEIGNGAFMDCTSLTTVTLPYIIASIGDSAFENCVALLKFSTSENSGKNSSALKSIGSRAFYGCTSLTEVDAETTQKIGAGTGRLGASAFENCENLVTVNLPQLQVFEEKVFKNAKSLKSVVFGKTFNISVAAEAFRNCVALSDVTAKIVSAEDSAFRNCVSIRTITFADSIDYIGNNAFNGCALIQKVVIPASVSIIGDSAFEGCRGISSLTFMSDETLVSVGYSAFGGCSLLTKVSLPSSLMVLNASAFYGCNDLAFVSVGENIAEIGENAFALCADGIEVRFAGVSVPKIGGDLFTGTANAKISVKQGYENTFKAVLGTKYTIVSYNA